MGSRAAVFFAVILTASGQTVSSGAEERIRAQIFGGQVDGIGLKEQSRMGDAAAALIDKVIDGQTLGEDHLGAILAIVHVAFSRPAALENVSDREPKQTLRLLKQLAASTKDASQKAQITEEEEFVRNQFAMVSSKDSPDCMLANFSAAHSPLPSQTPYSYQLSVVYLALTNPRRRVGPTSLRRLGDDVAGYLQTIMGDCTMRPEDLRIVLEVIRLSFVKPEAEPKKVLSLLESMDAATADAALKAEIAKTRGYVIGPRAASQ